MNRDAVKTYLTGLQERIVTLLEQTDGHSFLRDAWQRPEGGEGLSCVIEEGKVFERGGVNFSHVRGQKLPASATAKRQELAGCGFEAMGLSLVLHPRNPYAPTSHFNLRFFCAQPSDAEPVWWFGGGFDLTPYYGFDDDARHWHRTARDAAGPHYSKLKQACDESKLFAACRPPLGAFILPRRILAPAGQPKQNCIGVRHRVFCELPHRQTVRITDRGNIRIRADQKPVIAQSEVAVCPADTIQRLIRQFQEVRREFYKVDNAFLSRHA